MFTGCFLPLMRRWLVLFRHTGIGDAPADDLVWANPIPEVVRYEARVGITRRREMLMVTGANGNLGRQVSANLQALVGPSGFVAGTRDPSSAFARELRASGVEVRHVDFDDPDTLTAAFERIEAALIISTYAANSIRPRQNLNAIEAARRAGVRQLAYTSFAGAGPTARADHSVEVHWPTEQALMASGMEYTILRHALYADIMVGDLNETLATGVLRRAGGTAACAYIARDDLGWSAANVLTNPGHENRIYTETMEETLTCSQIAAAMSEVFDRDIRYEAVPADEWPAYMTRAWGVPAELAKSSLGTLRAIENGELDITSRDYESITGRKPKTMRQFLESVAAARRAG
jgi:NAD(P)H dehydrogenase (quinone)